MTAVLDGNNVRFVRLKYVSAVTETFQNDEKLNCFQKGLYIYFGDPDWNTKIVPWHQIAEIDSYPIREEDKE